MVFSSVLFLFTYLPVVLAVYFITPFRFRNAMLLAANLLFYGWGEPVYVALMVLSVLVSWGCGVMQEKYRAQPRAARIFLFLSIAINLGFLILFKYYDFLISNLAVFFPALQGAVLGLTLPIGISFYTFQIISYNIDLARQDAPVQKSPVAYGTYVTLFPQLIAGPIVRYRDVAEQMENRRETVEQFASGVQLFVVGAAKKVLLANNVGALWETMKGAQTVAGAWLGALAFAFQLYFDFAGYSDMARGLGRMFGFTFLKNFDYPYISKSATEFWRRWHISLGTWFREYVYIPLGGNRRGKARTYFNIFAVWALTGIWHGAAWNFILWGLYFAGILMIEKAFLLKFLQKLPNPAQHVYALFIILLSWVLFANDNLKALSAFAVLFGASGAPVCNAAFFYYLRSYLPVLLCCAVACTPLAARLYSRLGERGQQAAGLLLTAGGLLLLTAYLVDATYNPFLYFRF